MSNKRGITLIALIITIIVMLILVGVTINVAMQGGLFNKARTASEQTQVETNKEMLLSEVVASLDSNGNINFTTLNAKAQELGFTVKSNGVYEKDGYTYTVDSTTGLVTARKTNSGGGSTPTPSGNLSDLEKYILGADGTGRVLGGENATGEVAGILDMENCTFLVDPEDSNSNIYQNVKWGYIGDDYETIYIRYGRDVYSFKMTEIEEGKDTDDDSDDAYYIKSVAGSLSGPTTPSGNLGKYATYNGERYIVMEEDSNTVTLISANALGSVSLGYNDPNAISYATDLNSDGTISDGEKGIYSYNNSVNTLVEACKTATGITTVDGTNVISIRSAGNTNVKYTSGNVITGSDTAGTYTYNNEETGASSDWYTANGFNSYGMKPEDTNYSTDETAMRALAIYRADNGGRYWLASRRVDAGESYVYFYVRDVHDTGGLDGSNVCDVISNGYAYGYDYSRAVRPVITLNSNAPGLNIEN